MHGALGYQLRGKVAKGMLYVPYRLGGQCEFYVARPHWRNRYDAEAYNGGIKSCAGAINAAYSNDQERVSIALYPSEMVKIIIPNLEPPVPKCHL